ncbi:sulfotransferase family 2 domain-containing protein [Roseovarius sp.]|uniref:sulfotransferase family 2 domain-containing protein n=1 Tax=Roseovarius sp. TaxID=1486281 RepID=UPI002605AB0A|nr:sulfotransferase family 2 domain-containing protein [Roseovarius sp.]MDM8168652.1 sulfotransferase family 2 domain-containing protein [Roseovarius sp.]
MIISPGRNYIFVHIPKTGGTSLALALEGRAMKDDLLIGDTPKARKRRGRVQGVTSAGRLWKHSTLRDIDGLVSRAFIEGAFVVTMVRNPWDRVVSYYHWLRAQGFDHPAVRLAKAVGFSAFLNHPQTRESLRAHPYGSYVTGPEGGERCDLFIRLERFAEDAEALWEHLGFRLELPRVNASERGVAYRDYYSETDSALVGELCGADIARFGYVFS